MPWWVFCYCSISPVQWSAGEDFEDMKQMGLSGASPLGGLKTKAPNPDYHNHRDAPPAVARQAEVARD